MKEKEVYLLVYRSKLNSPFPRTSKFLIALLRIFSLFGLGNTIFLSLRNEITRISYADSVYRPFLYHRLWQVLYSLLLILAPVALLGQTHRYVHYSVAEGLPSSTVYHIIQDKAGYMWFGTESGLARFDGHTFQTWNRERGLPENEILRVREDAEGRIWCWGILSISYYQNGRIYPIDLQKEFGGRRPEYVLVDGGIAKVAFGLPTDEIYSFINGKWVRQALAAPPFLRVGQYTYAERNWRLWFENYENQIEVLPDNYPALKPMVLYKNVTEASAPIRQFEPRNIPLRFTYEDRKGHIWLCTTDRGVLEYLPEALKNGGPPLAVHLPKQVVNTLAEDRQGNIWFATMRNGVFFLSSRARQIQLYSHETGLSGESVECLIMTQSGSLVMGFANGSLSRLQNQTLVCMPSIGKARYSRIRTMIERPEGRVLFASDDHLGAIEEDNAPYSLAPYYAIKSVLLTRDSLYIGTHGLVVHPYEKIPSTRGDLLPPTKPDTTFRERIYAIVEHPATQQLWMGNLRGLFKRINGKWQKEGPNNPLLSVSIQDLVFTTDGTLLIATNGAGFLLYKEGRVRQIARSHGLSSNVCHKVRKDEEGYFWLATDRGLNVVAPLPTDGSVPRIYHLREGDGLPSEELNDLVLFKDSVFVGTTKGLAFFPRKLVFAPRSSNAPTRITRVQIMDRDTTLLPVYTLPYHQNRIKIEFQGLHYAAPGLLQYRYRLQGLESQWNISSVNQANYPALPPGTYTLEVYATYSQGEPATTPTTLSITIHPHYTQTTWFRLLILIALAGIFLSIVILRNRYLRQKERARSTLEKRIVELELQALRAQMNPHFIFNSLSAIQHFIARKDSHSAHKFLSSFSRLIRQVLENSGRSSIPLKEELALIQLYLDLENMRLEESFDAEIHVAPELETSTVYIPSMVIQPLVENAIKHGFRALPNRGKLSISVEKVSQSILCKIEDNGIGRDRAAMAPKGPDLPHTSFGMKLSRERLNVLNHLQKTEGGLQVEDLFSSGGKPAGTRITLRIPIQPNPVLC